MSSFDRVLPQLWMAQSKEVRNLLAERFELKKSGITEVRDQDVVSDGYTQDDLLGITQERMTDYVGSEESFPRLWELTVAKAHYELTPPIEMKMSTPIEEKSDETVVLADKPKRKYVRKTPKESK